MWNTSCQYSIPKLFSQRNSLPTQLYISNCFYSHVCWSRSLILFPFLVPAFRAAVDNKKTNIASAALLSQVVVLLQFATNLSTVRLKDSKDIIAFQFLGFRMTDQRWCICLLFAARVIFQEDRVMTIKSLHLRLVNLAC
jgi:hypothetical protein